MPIPKFILFISILMLSFTKMIAQEITMFQGFLGYEYYQDDIEISKTEVNTLMQQHELTKVYWDKSRNHKRYAMIALGTQLTTTFLAIRSINNNSFGSPTTGAKLLLAASLSSGVVGIGFSLSSASLKKKSILGYNKLQSKEGLIFHLGQTYNGIGIVCSF